jgi:hypothetical protein
MDGGNLQGDDVRGIVEALVEREVRERWTVYSCVGRARASIEEQDDEARAEEQADAVVAIHGAQLKDASRRPLKMRLDALKAFPQSDSSCLCSLQGSEHDNPLLL